MFSFPHPGRPRSLAARVPWPPAFPGRPRSLAARVPWPPAFPGRPRSLAARVPWPLLALFILAIVLKPVQASTPHYDVTFSGGTIVSTPPAVFSPGDSNNYYGSGSASSGGPNKTCTASAIGPLTATFTWNNGGDSTVLPPPSVIISQTCTASWSDSPNNGATGTGTADNGLSNGVLTTSPNGQSMTSTLYTGKDNPGQSFTVTCSPTAQFNGTDGAMYDASISGTVNATYSALTYPVTVTPVGAVQDQSENWDILIGQKCGPILAGIPSGCTVSNYQWKVSGSTFQTWTANSSSTASPMAPAH